MKARLCILYLQAGQPTFPCGGDSLVSDCLAGVDSNGFTAYSQFYTHTHNMCYYLQSQQWQQQTELTVARLADTGRETVARLERAQDIQER